jgi:hypothetical protein
LKYKNTNLKILDNETSRLVKERAEETSVYESTINALKLNFSELAEDLSLAHQTSHEQQATLGELENKVLDLEEEASINRKEKQVQEHAFRLQTQEKDA